MSENSFITRRKTEKVKIIKKVAACIKKTIQEKIRIEFIVWQAKTVKTIQQTNGNRRIIVFVAVTQVIKVLF